MSIRISSFVAAAIFVVTPVIATVAAATDPCVIDTIRIDEPCTDDACRFTLVAATESEGFRHVAWRQTDGVPRVRTARVAPDGTVQIADLTIDTPAGVNAITGLAARGDLLAVGVVGRVELFRLVDQEWNFEASLPMQSVSDPARRIAISATGETDRVVATAKDIVAGNFFGEVVRVFRRDAMWTIEQTIPVASLSQNFGADVAIDGTTIAIGAPAFGSTFLTGAVEVRVYDLIDGTWTATETVTGFPWSWHSSGHRIALAGGTLVATNAPFNPMTNLLQPMHLHFWHRGPAGFTPTDFVFGTTAARRGWELDAFVDGDDVRVATTVYRLAPVTDAAFIYRVRDGVVFEQRSLPTPVGDPAGLHAPCWGIAAVNGADPWVAVTAPDDPAGASMSIIALDGDPGSCEGKFAEQPADLNGDGVVDGADLGALLAQWGVCRGCAADLNGDGVVDGADLGILLAAWSG